MEQHLSNQIDEYDLMEPNIVSQLLQEVLTEDEGLFSIQGSLQDHRVDDCGNIAKVKRAGDEFDWDLTLTWPDEFKDKAESEKRRVRDTLMRAGIARPVNLSKVMAKLRQIDDVIIGADTNILLDSIFTAHLLEEIYKERFPNWILIAVPKLVMAEIENKANSKIQSGNHPRTGWPSYSGRIGNRGLQELMDLDTKDEARPGLALMTVGSLDDTSMEIAQQSNWLLDSEIRQQFHEFLADISFHKGTYFISQDRVNVMMSGTEGSEGLYLQKPKIENVETGQLSPSDLTEIIYELCVQFGDVKLTKLGDPDFSLKFSIFWAGKQVSDWRHSRIRIEEMSIPTW